MGSDAEPIDRIYVPRVSIHAPRVGSDAVEARNDAAELLFQSTPPCGERRGASHGARWLSCFNPRPAWRTTLIPGAPDNIKRGNPRPSHGKRPSWYVESHRVQSFNPRLLHGKRRVEVGDSLTCRVFQYTPRMGSNKGWSSTQITVIMFQSTPPYGE